MTPRILLSKSKSSAEAYEKAAKKYPPVDMDFGWMFSRLEDGTAVRP